MTALTPRSRWQLPLLIAIPVVGILVILAAVFATRPAADDTTSAPDSTVPLVGLTLSEVHSHLPDSGNVIYDLSFPVGDVDASYDGTAPGLFTVITACGQTTADAPADLVLGVIPTEQVTATIRAEAAAAAGGYDTLLSECS
ncbi:MAG: hypothetical protein ACTJHU_01900 [Mycetocola sp.]